MNPYHGLDFFQFFALFFSRFLLVVRGTLPFTALAADEIQFLVLVAVGTLGSLVGIFLVLRRMSMLAGALSHTMLLGIVVYFMALSYFKVNHGGHFAALPELFAMALITALVTTSLSNWLHRRLRLPKDASIALVFSTLFALAILLLSYTSKSLHVGIEMIVGNVDAVGMEDLSSIFSVLLIVALFVVFFFKELKLTTFDSLYAASQGVSTGFYHHALMMMTSIALIATFRVVGILMSLAFFIAPALIARLVAKRLIWVIITGFTVTVMSSLFAVALSRYFLSCYGWPLSTAGIVVALLFAFYFLARLFSPHRGLVMVKRRQKKALDRFHNLLS